MQDWGKATSPAIALVFWAEAGRAWSSFLLTAEPGTGRTAQLGRQAPWGREWGAEFLSVL